MRIGLRDESSRARLGLRAGALALVLNTRQIDVDTLRDGPYTAALFATDTRRFGVALIDKLMGKGSEGGGLCRAGLWTSCVWCPEFGVQVDVFRFWNAGFGICCEAGLGSGASEVMREGSEPESLILAQNERWRHA